MLWEFIELPSFADLRDELFSDVEFLSLQEFLCERPEACDLAISFLVRAQAQIVLVTAYGKGEREDVPRAWLKRIKEVYIHEQS